jgi:hypothetical protein
MERYREFVIPEFFRMIIPINATTAAIFRWSQCKCFGQIPAACFTGSCIDSISGNEAAVPYVATTRSESFYE